MVLASERHDRGWAGLAGRLSGVAFHRARTLATFLAFFWADFGGLLDRPACYSMQFRAGARVHAARWADVVWVCGLCGCECDLARNCFFFPSLSSKSTMGRGWGSGRRNACWWWIRWPFCTCCLARRCSDRNLLRVCVKACPGSFLIIIIITPTTGTKQVTGTYTYH
jgi:hypothetical protein